MKSTAEEAKPPGSRACPWVTIPFIHRSKSSIGYFNHRNQHYQVSLRECRFTMTAHFAKGLPQFIIIRIRETGNNSESLKNSDS